MNAEDKMSQGSTMSGDGSSSAVAWSGEPLFWRSLFQRLAWASFVMVFGLTLLASLSMVHNPLDLSSMDQYCPRGMTDHRRCEKGVVTDAFGAMVGIAVTIIALLEIMNILFRALTGRPIERYQLDRKQLSVKRHSAIVPSWNLCSGVLSFRPEGRSIKVWGMTELGLKKSLRLGPFEQVDQQDFLSCLNAVRERA